MFIYVAIVQYEAALKVYKEQNQNNVQHVSFAMTLFNLGVIYRTLAQSSKEVASSETADSVEPAMRMARPTMEKMALHDQARMAFEQVLEIRQSVLDATHPDLAVTRGQLGLQYYHCGLASKAVDTLERALETLTSTLGPNHLKSLVVQNNLAFVYKKRGEYARAIDLYAQVLTIRKTKLGRQHQETIIAAHNLSEALRSNGQEDQAQVIQHEILTDLEQPELEKE